MEGGRGEGWDLGMGSVLVPYVTYCHGVGFCPVDLFKCSSHPGVHLRLMSMSLSQGQN